MRVSNSIGKCLFGCTLALTWSVHGQTGSEPSFDLKVIDQQTVEMSWTNLAPGFIYQESESPSASARWKGVLQNPVLNGNKASVTRSLSGDWTRWFFRLRSKGASSGLDYLNATQSPDGTWGAPSGTRARDTATALDALALYGQNNAYYSQGLAGLLGLGALNNDFKARRAMTLAVAGFDTTTFLTDLLDSQNDFLSLQVGYDVLRLVLDFELGTMQLDPDGLWIDPGPMTQAALAARTPRWSLVAQRETPKQTGARKLSHTESSLTAR